MNSLQGVSDALKFKTQSGVEYLYDDCSGLIFPNEPVLLENRYAENGGYLSIECNKPALPSEITPEYIKTFIENNSFNQLTLEMTSACNFRCKYCVYGEHYPETRTFSSHKMDFITAQKAVCYYMTQVERKYRRNPNAFPTIGFYGGEPLLEFPLIRQIVDYIEDAYSFFPKIVYTITTNGFLLTKEIMRYLVNHNFSIIVSLDGNKENHDRNRVTAHGEGTFDTVFANMNEFRKEYPEYKKFGISACYDYKTNLYAMRDFFQKENLFIVKIAQVSGTNTDYYNFFSKEEEARFRTQYNALRQDFFESAQKGVLASDSFLFPLFGTAYAEFAFHSMLREKRPFFSPYTGSCVPGDKIYVTADGKYHVCERVPHDMPIGNADSGLDFHAIAELISTYNKSICTACSHCNITKLCGVCYATVRKDNGFHHVEGYCHAFQFHCSNMMSDITGLLEKNPVLMENITIDYYQMVIDTAGYIVE
jgi:uncharacterized protein